MQVDDHPNPHLEVEAGDSLQLVYREQSSLSYTLQEGSTLELIHTGSADIKVTLHARSHLKTFYVGTEGERRECRYHITLAGEETRATLLGLSMVNRNQDAPIHVEGIHQRQHHSQQHCQTSL